MPELVPQELEDSDDEVEDEEEEESVPTIRCSTRISGGDRKLEKYTLATKVYKHKDGHEHHRAIEKAEIKEIEQLFVDLQALMPVFKDEMGNITQSNCFFFFFLKNSGQMEYNMISSSHIW